MSDENCAVAPDGSLKDAQDINWQYDPDSAVLPSNTWTSHVDNESGKSMGAVSKDAFTTLMGAGKSSAAVFAGQRKSNRTRQPSTKVLQAQDVPSKGKRKSSPAPTKRRIYRKASDGSPLARVAIPAPPAPIPSLEFVTPTQVPHPSSSTDAPARTKHPAPVDSDSNCHVQPHLDNTIQLDPACTPVDMGRMIPHIPLSSQDPATQFHSQGFNSEQQTFVEDFVTNHHSTIQELQEEQD
ncbi:hypothetical protein BDP27DRAFT_1421614 [Rhodocollybia butyracea]|uniref:Uncharacterized protein n=1 Tax=Rhodocollybia butyracea TaxID=206335 RepID=A0A9P5PUL2_9AGAR|nr:hypothetical protein BDP27DRAFT_1421614 [Rhodocollybia butyracea]